VGIPRANLKCVCERESQVPAPSQLGTAEVLAEETDLPCCRLDLDGGNRAVSENGHKPWEKRSCDLGCSTLISNDLREFPRW
jgi:hypothetical protein